MISILFSSISNHLFVALQTHRIMLQNPILGQQFSVSSSLGIQENIPSWSHGQYFSLRLRLFTVRKCTCTCKKSFEMKGITVIVSDTEKKLFILVRFC